MEVWRNDRERRGLLRLLLSEIEHNYEVMRTISERLRNEFPVEDLIGHPDFLTLKMRTWIDVRGRTAALVPAQILGELESYYSPLEVLLTLVGFAGMVSNSFDRTLRAQIQEMKPDWTVVATRNPYQEQFDKLNAAQERTSQKIEAYLARPWWGSLFLGLDGLAPRRERA